tara:strand:+ start:9324 stop:12335 length:3012 start_codon:yes stop_codon:yes gene_type:complete
MLLFSDLHLSKKTFQTCLQVLRRVHLEAKTRNVSVGFLGDFFDHVYNKGTLPVDILNALLRFFETEWSVPMIMIPGNHDYFDASETEHGLTPFQYASPHITVLDVPTVVNRQLWVPWRRCNETVERILREQADVDVVFGHFDIIGFKLNPTKMSTEGLQRETFPSHIPIYTGHYHTPQVHGNIRYLGSPYQLSLSEAEDRKALVLLDTAHRVQECIPIDIGPHQYKWTTQELVARSHQLKPHDRVAVTAAVTDHVMSLVGSLEEKGITVQVKKQIAVVTTRLEQQDSPQQLLQSYGQVSGVDMTADAWVQVCQWLKEHPPGQQNYCAADVRPVRIQVDGFGPFKGPVSLALEGQGFTLISGECNESKDASNGAGKSMLASGAWLWACTGMIDGRGTLSFGGDVVHTGATIASVSVSGTVGASTSSWRITRTLGAQKKHQLTLTIDNKDCTRSTISATQKAIATDLFGLELSAGGLHGWLLRNSVWSQMTVPRWLDASDTAAKQEISPFANMDVWLALYDKAKARFKNAKSEVQNIGLRWRTTEQERHSAEHFYSQQLQARTSWETNHRKSMQMAADDLAKSTEKLATCRVPERPTLVDNMPAIKLQVETKRNMLATEQAKKAQMPAVPTPLPVDMGEVPELQQRQTQASLVYRDQVAVFNQARRALQHFHSAGECATCHRPFDVDSNQLVQLQQAQETAKACLEQGKDRAGQAQLCLSKATENAKHHRHAKQLIQIESKIAQYTEELSEMTAKLEKAQQYAHLLDTYRLSHKMYKMLEQTVAIDTRQVEKLRGTTCPIVVSREQLDRLETTSGELEQQQLQAQKTEENLKAMVGWLGPRGIQTYAMEYAVQKLSAVTTQWLQKFFNTDDIALKAYFDSKERLVRRVECAKHAGIMSGGQWRRAQLASFMAWREMSSQSFPLLVMDESCTSMDQIGIQSVQQTLRDWCEEDDRRTCLFITHEPGQHRDTSIYQNHVRILHKRGRSSLVETDITQPNQKKRKTEE